MCPHDYHARWPGSDHYSKLIPDPDEQGGMEVVVGPQAFPKEKKEVGTSAPRATCPPTTDSHYTNTLLPILEPFITSCPESPLAAAWPQEEDGKALQTLGCDSSSPRPLVPLPEASGGSTAP